jgi:ethanolamine ammonia-lyase small subunit
MSDEHNLIPTPGWPEIVRKIRLRTPARIFVERGASYTTKMALELRGDHARAVDAVWTEFDLHKDFPVDFVARWELFEISSQAESKSQFLLRPDLGRKLSVAGRTLIAQSCVRSPDVQIVIGDGLSGAAVSEQVPALFPLLQERLIANGWSVGVSFAIRYCRVGIMNEIGEVLAPRVLVLLIGERPGLATAASLSAYMGYCPLPGHSDAHRNLISNIHARGIHVEEAADRITNLAARMMDVKRSGTVLREDATLPAS